MCWVVVEICIRSSLTPPIERCAVIRQQNNNQQYQIMKTYLGNELWAEWDGKCMTISERNRTLNISTSIFLDSGQLTELGRFHFLCVESAKLGFAPAMEQPLALDAANQIPFANEGKAVQMLMQNGLSLSVAANIVYGETLARQNALLASVDRSLDAKA